MRRTVAIVAAFAVVVASAAAAYALAHAEPGFRPATAPPTAQIVQPRGQRPVFMRPVTGTLTTPRAITPAAATTP